MNTNTKLRYISISFLLMSIATTCLAASAQTIQVGNVDELYSAVNNPANADATLNLAPGVYMLSATDPFGAARPNGGRLELQENMSLMGVIGDRIAVVIDANNLPASSYTVPGFTGRVAGVRIGRGRNSIEWVTVRNARFGTSNIDTTLRSPGNAFVTVAHIASSGSQRGVDLINHAQLGASGRTIEADVVDNDLFNNALGTIAQGMRAENVRTGPGTVINVRMTDNRSWGNLTGRFMGNNQATDSTVNVFSAGNRFFGNSVGSVIIAGYSSFATTQSNGNTVNFEAHGDHFTDNTSPWLYFGGIIVVGGESASTAQNVVNNNTVNVALWGCRMEGNNTWDILGVGARFMPESVGSPGVNNHVTIEIHDNGPGHGRWRPVEFFADTIPANPSLNNTVTVIR